MGIISIIAKILSGLELAKKVKDALDEVIPEPPKDLKDKHRWMQCTVKNATQFPLLLHESYFDSGRYWTAPGSAAAFDQNVFSCNNQDNSIFTGVSGGNSFKIVLDENHVFDMALGWTAPQNGRFKAGVVESSSAKDGYDVATPTGNSIFSKDQYEGKDKDGNPIKIEFQISAAPGQEPTFVITEVRL